jgi:hypothetical protein
MLEVLVAIGLVLVVVPIVLLIASKEPKRKKPRYKGMSGALGVFNELYNPSAHKAAVIVEEQAKARKQTGNEDKKKPQSK